MEGEGEREGGGAASVLLILLIYTNPLPAHSIGKWKCLRLPFPFSREVESITQTLGAFRDLGTLKFSRVHV